MELQNEKQRFEGQGVKLAAISYDSPAILKDFAERHKIDYPLLADPDSKIITRYGVLNAQATGMRKGIARPGYFYIDASGTIREKYFEAKYTDRFTANNVMGKLFPELAGGVSQKIAAPHLNLELNQSDEAVVPGSRLSFSVQIELPENVHVYAPSVNGYEPIQLELQPSREAELTPPAYPAPTILYLEAIKERVPVFEGSVRITFDGTIGTSPDFTKTLGTNGRTITIAGQLNYQACDKTTCYFPVSAPLRWHIKVLPLDRQRSPGAIQHK